MMFKVKKMYLFLMVCVFFSCMNRQVINIELKEKLDELCYKDQAVRELYFTELSKGDREDVILALGLDSFNYKDRMWDVIRSVDSSNYAEVESMIAEYGYPGRSLVGDSTYKAAWYIIQHSDSIEKFLPLIKNAAEIGELDMTHYAMMYDRYLMQQNKMQVYGTQGAQYKKGYVIWPIENPAEVNARRLEVGFDTSIEEYAKQPGFEYAPIEIELMRDYLLSIGVEF